MFIIVRNNNFLKIFLILLQNKNIKILFKKNIPEKHSLFALFVIQLYFCYCYLYSKKIMLYNVTAKLLIAKHDMPA